MLLKFHNQHRLGVSISRLFQWMYCEEVNLQFVQINFTDATFVMVSMPFYEAFPLSV